jgi:hypothetical protein
MLSQNPPLTRRFAIISLAPMPILANRGEITSAPQVLRLSRAGENAHRHCVYPGHARAMLGRTGEVLPTCATNPFLYANHCWRHCRRGRWQSIRQR